MREFSAIPLTVVALAMAPLSGRCLAETHVYEVVEEVFHAKNDYAVWSQNSSDRGERPIASVFH